MPDAMDKDEIIKLNPNVDPEKIEVLDEYIKRTYKDKMRKAHYDLASPINRRKVIIGHNDQDDPRTIHLNSVRNRR